MKKGAADVVGILVFITILAIIVVIGMLSRGKTNITDSESQSTIVNDFINQVQKTTQKLNDVLLKVNKVGDLIEEKYADINPANEKDAQRIKEYLELMDYLGQASAELRKSVAVLPEALKTPVDTTNLLPIEKHLKIAEIILEYIEMRLSD